MKRKTYLNVTFLVFALCGVLLESIPADAKPIPDLGWEPEPFKYQAGVSQRYIDYENGDDSNPGTKKRPWKHHPWDQEARGYAVAAEGIHTYAFKKGVVYRGQLSAKESGGDGNRIRLTVDPDWGQGAAILAGSMRVSQGWERLSQQDQLPFPALARDKYRACLFGTRTSVIGSTPTRRTRPFG